MFRLPTQDRFDKILEQNIALRRRLFDIDQELMELEGKQLERKFSLSNDLIKRSILRSLLLKNMKMYFMMKFPHFFKDVLVSMPEQREERE